MSGDMAVAMSIGSSGQAMCAGHEWAPRMEYFRLFIIDYFELENENDSVCSIRREHTSEFGLKYSIDLYFLNYSNVFNTN